VKKYFIHQPVAGDDGVGRLLERQEDVDADAGIAAGADVSPSMMPCAAPVVNETSLGRPTEELRRLVPDIGRQPGGET
jgi:hypothetical protein